MSQLDSEMKVRAGYVCFPWLQPHVNNNGTTMPVSDAARLLRVLSQRAQEIATASDSAEYAQAYSDLGEYVADGLPVWRTTTGQVPDVADPSQMVDRLVAFVDSPAAVEALGGAVTRPAWLRPRTVETVHEVGRLRVVAEITIAPADEANDVVAAEVVEDET